MCKNRLNGWSVTFELPVDFRKRDVYSSDNSIILPILPILFVNNLKRNVRFGNSQTAFYVLYPGTGSPSRQRGEHAVSC